MKHIVEPLFVSHCILVQYCFLSFVSIILRHLCPVHQVRAKHLGFWRLRAGKTKAGKRVASATQKPETASAPTGSKYFCDPCLHWDPQAYNFG